jgi:hypothetical protein
MNKTQQLQAILDENLKEYHGEWYIEYRPNRGWYAVPDMPRHFNDEGIFLGKVFGIAKRSIGLAF